MGRKQLMTAREIEAYEPPPLSRERPQFRLGCGGGLYKLYTWTGTQSWQHRVRMPGVNTWITLGECGRTSEGKVDCSEARKRLAQAKRRLAAGEPPEAIKFGEAAVRMAAMQKEKAQSSGLTFGEIAEAWMAQANVVEDVQKHRLGQYQNYLEGPLGARPLASITQEDLVNAAKSPLVKSASGRAAMSVPQALAQMIRQICDFARMTHPELANFAADAHVGKLVPKAPPPVHRACIVNPGELGELLRRIRDLYFSCRNPATGLAMRMLPLVALRPGEVCRSVWNEVDLNKRLWLIPVGRMKMRRAHLVPLSSQAMAILHEAKKFSKGSEYIFPSYSSKKCGHVCLQTPIQSLHRLGYDTGKDICPHGFRGTFTTLLRESGLFRKEVIKIQLAHVNEDKVDAAYNHAEYMEERWEMMQVWADYLDALRDGSTLTLREWAKSRPKPASPFEDE